MTSIKGQRGPQPQNSTPWECRCGRTVHGNGGIRSHTRRCIPWNRHLLAQNTGLLARIDDGTYFTGPRRRASETTRAELRRQAAANVTRLTALLATLEHREVPGGQ